MAEQSYLTRTRFIVNPASANGKTGRHWPKLWNTIGQHWPGKPDYRLTEAPGHATTLTRQALSEGITTIIAVGGDGTLNEVVNGFLADDKPVRPEAVLGMLELGTGGDFARTLGMPREAVAAVEWLLQATPTPTDVGKATCRGLNGAPHTRYFLNILDFGLGGSVVQWVNSHSKTLGGTVTFLAGILVNLLTYTNKTVRYTIDGGAETTARINNFIVANARYFGGGLFPAPMAAVDDGRLDGVIIGDISRWEAIRNLGRLRRGTHLEHPRITHHPLTALRADSPETVYIDADGELIGTLPLEVTVLPAAVKVLR